MFKLCHAKLESLEPSDLFFLILNHDGELREVVLRPYELDLVEASFYMVQVFCSVLVSGYEVLRLFLDDFGNLVDVLCLSVWTLAAGLA